MSKFKALAIDPKGIRIITLAGAQIADVMEQLGAPEEDVKVHQLLNNSLVFEDTTHKRNVMIGQHKFKYNLIITGGFSDGNLSWFNDKLYSILIRAGIFTDANYETMLSQYKLVNQTVSVADVPTLPLLTGASLSQMKGKRSSSKKFRTYLQNNFSTLLYQFKDRDIEYQITQVIQHLLKTCLTPDEEGVQWRSNAPAAKTLIKNELKKAHAHGFVEFTDEEQMLMKLKGIDIDEMMVMIRNAWTVESLSNTSIMNDVSRRLIGNERNIEAFSGLVEAEEV